MFKNPITMKVKALLIFTFLFTISSYSGNKILKDSTSYWTEKNKVTLLFTQNSFVNWSSGGNNSIAGILKLYMQRNYKNKHTVWSNELKGSYGLNKEEKRELRKTEDKFEINSTFGYRNNVESNWYYSAKFNFLTQFANGYKYPNTDKPISRLFAPAYLFLGIGSEYSANNRKIRVYLSPVTNKTTFVFSPTLANEGAFGVKAAVKDADGNIVKKGEKSKIEFGTLITGEWKAKVMENIKMANKLTLYSDYLHDYGNVDVNWELNFDLTINKHITANVGSHLIFDDDILSKEDIDDDGDLDILGPKIQLKQLLGVGFAYNF